jgi:hypothetical protein
VSTVYLIYAQHIAGVNIHLDTLTEILHTILLGVVKYFWGQTVWILDKSKVSALFQACLNSINTDGLHVPSLNAEYICHYKGSLIGKHFKSLAQIIPYLIYDLLPQTIVNSWTKIGELVMLLWHTKIINLEKYLADLSCTIDNFLIITAQCAPSILINKPKFHFLLHLPMYIRRFGPAIIFSTEHYESFNHVFCLISIYSNKQAPSWDMCFAFAAQEIVRHIATGGFWYEPLKKTWVQAGSAILQYMANSHKQAQMLGITLENVKKTGK